MSWLGLDIGGANLKAADASGYAALRPFALWRAPSELTNELRAVIAAAPPHGRLAATMTAELADCFATKADGVRAIIDALTSAAGEREVRIYTTTGAFVSPHEAAEAPLAAAASNWHALAAFAARFARERSALLIGIGSTTADIIPIVGGHPATSGATDPERLQAGELVYTGVERTPVAAVVAQLPWRGRLCPVASELFATSLDAHLWLGNLPEEPHNVDTADGRPRTRAAAHARLARMVCADVTMFDAGDAQAAAEAVRDAQLRALAAALVQVTSHMAAPPETIILSGHGEFLGRAAVAAHPWPRRPPQVLSLNTELGPALSRCAPAYAVAVLAEERQAEGALLASWRPAPSASGS